MANNLRSGRVPPGPTQRTMPSSPSPRLLLVLHLLLFLPLVPLLPPNLLARVSVFPILFYSFFLLSFPISLQPLQSFSAFLSSQWSPSLVGLSSSMFYSANNDQVIANRVGHLAHSHASMTIVVRSRSLACFVLASLGPRGVCSATVSSRSPRAGAACRHVSVCR